MIFETVQDILCTRLSVNEDEVTMDTYITNVEEGGHSTEDILDHLWVDYQSIIEIFSDLIGAFGVEFPDEVLETIQTVGDIVRYIEYHY